jgi:hypothetical protein
LCLRTDEASIIITSPVASLAMSFRNRIDLKWTIALAAIALTPLAYAHQWAEPYDADIVAHADAFVLARATGEFEVEIVKILAGEQTLPKKLRVDHAGQIALDKALDSHDPPFQNGASYFLYLNHVGKHWTLATASTHIAKRENNNVTGHFRSSCANSFFEDAWYRSMHVLWFKALRDDAQAQRLLQAKIHAELTLPAQTFRGEVEPASAQAMQFFRQHAANEILASLPTLGNELDLEPFLTLNDWQGQVSAVRALAARQDLKSTARLVEIAAASDFDDIVRLVAAVELAERKRDSKQRRALKTASANANDESMTLCGGSIMDPRLDARYSASLKEALAAAGK